MATGSSRSMAWGGLAVSLGIGAVALLAAKLAPPDTFLDTVGLAVAISSAVAAFACAAWIALGAIESKLK